MRLIRIAAVLAGFVLIYAPQRACASDAEALADMRCILVSLHTATLNTPAERIAGMMAASYYLGRLDGHSPHANIEQLVKSEAHKMTLAELRAESVRCGGVLEKKGLELQNIAAALSGEARGGKSLK